MEFDFLGLCSPSLRRPIALFLSFVGLHCLPLPALYPHVSHRRREPRLLIPALHFRFLQVFLPIEPADCFPTQPILIVFGSLESFLDLRISNVDSRKSIPARTAEQPYGLEMGTE